MFAPCWLVVVGDILATYGFWATIAVQSFNNRYVALFTYPYAPITNGRIPSPPKLWSVSWNRISPACFPSSFLVYHIYSILICLSLSSTAFLFGIKWQYWEKLDSTSFVWTSISLCCLSSPNPFTFFAYYTLSCLVKVCPSHQN